MTDTPNPLAALLRDVPRYDPDWTKEPFDRSEMVVSTDGDWLRRADVLAALTLPDMNEAAEQVIIALQTHGSGFHVDDDLQRWIMPAVKLITRLLAARAADAARIRWLEANIEAGDLVNELEKNRADQAEAKVAALTAQARDEAHKHELEQVRINAENVEALIAAEARIAALTAQVAALEWFAEISAEQALATKARAALTEEPK